MAGGTWERCVREVTLSADPETVGSVGAGWKNLSTALGYLRDALAGRSFIGPVAPGTERPNVGGLPGMLAGWKGSGGDAYREHLGEMGKDIEELITDASNVSGALTRIEADIRKAVASIPIPLMDDFGWNEWSLPNGTELDDARDGESQSGFLAALRKDYQSNPASYADGAFRDKADDLEATMKVDGQASDNKRGGLWDTKSHLDNWYNDNMSAANKAMSPLPTAVVDERPKLIVRAPSGQDDYGGYRPEDRVPPTGRPDIGGGFDGGADPSSVRPSIDSSTPKMGDPGPYRGDTPKITPPTIGGGDHGGGGTGGIGGGPGSLTPPSAGYPGTGDSDFGTGLAGASPPSTIGSGYSGAGGPGLGSAGAGGIGGGGVGAAGGIGGGGVGAAGGIGVGAVPGMMGGGNGKVPPMTSAANALRAAAGGAGGAGAAGAGAGGARGAGMMGAGMMGGGMGGHGAGAGSSGSEHSSWLTEDDDPWGSDGSASPGILR
ncbi:hypothetical protein [Micromonospora globbae]|uniref:hypothetical protein n=1 Tax=Micromonospora globbae TaxID=1894969 RepID=UPI003421FF4E